MNATEKIQAVSTISARALTQNWTLVGMAVEFQNLTGCAFDEAAQGARMAAYMLAVFTGDTAAQAHFAASMN